MGTRCDLKMSDCVGEAEVAMKAGSFTSNTCLPCGKAWQKRFPHRALDLSITPLMETTNG